MPLLSLSNVSYSYLRSAPVVRNMTVQFLAGERAVILGANGTGKSTLLALLNGLVFAQEGEVRAFGTVLSERGLEDRVFGREFRKKIAFVFQNPDVQLFSPTVWEDVAFGPLQLGLPQAQVRDIVDGLLGSLRIQDLRDRAPHTLSDGQKKKVAIASSLATDPEVLLMDEPTNGLDPRTQVWLIELLHELHRKGTTIIAATHDLAIAQDIAERAIVFSEEHTLAADGPLDHILQDDDLLLSVNLIHEHAHTHGGHAHVHRHGHFGHYHVSRGSEDDMHKGHSHSHGHGHEDHSPEGTEELRKLLLMLDHWIDHDASHVESYQEWAQKASTAGEEEIAREIHLAMDDSASVQSHLKRARAILAAKLVLRK
ncbi:MAG: energy-coupling factor ABC transporter ATP-binding protein [Nitrospirota bacterium]